MFYKHDISQSVSERNKRHVQATDKFPRHSNEWFAEYNLLHLQQISEKGLPNCYASFQDFLYDLYPDFSWDDRRDEQINLILADTRWPAIEQGIQRLFDFSMTKEFQQAKEDEDK